MSKVVAGSVCYPAIAKIASRADMRRKAAMPPSRVRLCFGSENEPARREGACG
ncbi:hypothetical protein X737_16545 [Mesorhizobium sp. L48C026A00]|nr:hypothetical protein X737_16545 [Mesorhizobium sp. L48C026A00]